MANRKAKITKASVDAMAAPAEGEARLWDDRLAGFCLRVYPTGRRVYAVKTRVLGAVRWYTIGKHGDPWTPDEARAEAKLIIAAAERDEDWNSLKRQGLGLTVGDLIDTYLRDGPATKPLKRASSWAADRQNLSRHVRPLIGAKAIAEVTAAQVSKMLADIAAGKTALDEKTGNRGRAIVRGGPGAAERTLATVRAMFNWAAEHHYTTAQNPAQRLRLPARPSKERFLSEAEAVQLFVTLDRLERSGELKPVQAALFKLLMLTGARRDEVAALRWTEVDLDRARLVLPPERTKAGGRGGTRHVPLNSLAVEILRGLPRTAPFVFPASKGESGHTTAATKLWLNKVRPAAELDGVRVHDLRHSFASFALADGASLAAIGKALGHANTRSTERYAHLSADAVLALSERIAGRFGAPDEN